MRRKRSAAWQHGGNLAGLGGNANTLLEPGHPPVASGAPAVFVKDGKVVSLALIPELSRTPGRQPDGVVVQGRRLVSGTCCTAPSPAAAAPSSHR